MSGMRARGGFDSGAMRLDTPSGQSGTGEESADQPLTFLQKLMVGGGAGVVGSMVVFPIDTIKARLMMQKPNPDGEHLVRATALGWGTFLGWSRDEYAT
jgi:hypothetical protein